MINCNDVNVVKRVLRGLDALEDQGQAVNIMRSDLTGLAEKMEALVLAEGLLSLLESTSRAVQGNPQEAGLALARGARATRGELVLPGVRP